MCVCVFVHVLSSCCFIKGVELDSVIIYYNNRLMKDVICSRQWLQSLPALFLKNSSV